MRVIKGTMCTPLPLSFIFCGENPSQCLCFPCHMVEFSVAIASWTKAATNPASNTACAWVNSVGATGVGFFLLLVWLWVIGVGVTGVRNTP